jgi:hypothetical protein
MDYFITNTHLSSYLKCVTSAIVSSDASITVKDNDLLVDADVWGRSDTTVTYRVSTNSGSSYNDLPLKITTTACPNNYLKLLDRDEEDLVETIFIPVRRTSGST